MYIQKGCNFGHSGVYAGILFISSIRAYYLIIQLYLYGSHSPWDFKDLRNPYTPPLYLPVYATGLWNFIFYYYIKSNWFRTIHSRNIIMLNVYDNFYISGTINFSAIVISLLGVYLFIKCITSIIYIII